MMEDISKYQHRKQLNPKMFIPIDHYISPVKQSHLIVLVKNGLRQFGLQMALITADDKEVNTHPRADVVMMLIRIQTFGK